ncbi:MAG: hypothetical protein NVSMB18_32610 [Acetobacteraceae bacterium]
MNGGTLLMVAMGQADTAFDCRIETGARFQRGLLARDQAWSQALGEGRSDRGVEALCRSILTRTVETEVIPRLLRAHGLGRAAGAVLTTTRSPALVTASHVSQLVDLSLQAAEPAAVGFVSAMQDQGFRAESLYLDLLAPAASRLGTLWEEDICDFTEVTIGLLRLQTAMRALSPAFIGAGCLDPADPRAAPRALLVPLPGEQHTFGLSMVFDFFRRAGWNVWTGPVASTGELATMVRAEWIDVVGFSLACDERLETARAEIRAIRRASRNPGLAVMVGGPPFVMDAGLAAAVGADGTAGDGRQAVCHATTLMQRDMERR